jgi:hypothetical protein
MVLYTINPRYNELIGGQGVRRRQCPLERSEMGYLRKHTLGYIANRRNKRRNTQCDYTIKVFILGFFFNSNSSLWRQR